MTQAYPQHPKFVIADAEKGQASLNQQVWNYAAQAEARGLELVVEIWARSSSVSRALNLWWRAGGETVEDTLTGVYLVRIDLVSFGPEAILKLTPFALAGVPLFLGWNPVGQVLTAREFSSSTPEDLALTLSAFVEDVLAKRPHSLNPRPQLGNAKWDAKLNQLRQDRGRWRRPAAPASVPTAQPQVAQAAVATAAVSAPQTVPAPTEPLSQAASPIAPAPAAAAFDFERYLARARETLTQFAERESLDLDFSLESLQALDRQLDLADSNPAGNQTAALIPLFGVYLGDTVSHHKAATWYHDATETSPINALKLRTHNAQGEQCLAPVALVLELAGDRSRSLFGQAVQLCSVS